MSSGTVSPSRLFEELLRQLGECHYNALQELEAKVNRLKNDRCLDAQKLEGFYHRNRQLKEQNTSLQDAISDLEERLRVGQCERSTPSKKNPKNSRDLNLQIVTEFKSKRITSEDKNTIAGRRKMRLQSSDSCLELEDGVIPDSPILTSSELGSKLKKQKNNDKKKNIRYAEKPLPGFNKSLFNEVVCTTKKYEEDEVLVLNTCEEDVPQISNDVDGFAEEVIADTCAFDLLEKHPVKVEKTTSQQNKQDNKLNSGALGRTSTRIYSPDPTTERSPSLLPVVKRSLQATDRTAEQKKQESNAERIQEAADTKKEEKHIHFGLQNRISGCMRNQGFKRKPLDDEEERRQSGTSSQDPPVPYSSPVFKKPNATFMREAEVVARKSPTLENLNPSHDQPAAEHETRHPVEPVWSVDPALALSMYDSETRDEEAEEEEELIDTDCTWVSHSLLQGRGQNIRGRGGGVSRLGQKANDSLEMMFDKTVDEDYKSFIGESQPCDDDEEEEEEEEMKIEKHEQDSPEKSKAQAIPYPHIAVVRRKDERRKLKGTTCKECETYYSRLPEEEKQKKLAACSRHRFHYVPPCTPENFWEVGFPSTQTCIERGYIREEEKPQERLRRRRPFSAAFSPKNSLEPS